MRSVYVFARVTSEELGSYLDSLVPRRGAAEQWLYPDPDKKILYIQITDDLYDELEPETLEEVLAHFGGERVTCLSIDVSGRYPGEEEVKEIVSMLLRRFEGIAMDDWSEHLWTLEEIVSGRRWNGQRFFSGN